MRVKRILTSVIATFDDFVTRVENHEAIADSVIEDVRKGAARIRVEIRRAGLRSAELERETQDLRRDVERWRARAVALGESGAAADRERALECVRRLESAESRKRDLEVDSERHAASTDALRRQLARVEQHLTELERRRAELVSMSAVAGSAKVADAHCLDNATRSGDVFDRWEVSIAAAVPGAQPVDDDAFARAFDREEEDTALAERLDDLMQGREVDDA